MTRLLFWLLYLNKNDFLPHKKSYFLHKSVTIDCQGWRSGCTLVSQLWGLRFPQLWGLGIRCNLSRVCQDLPLIRGFFQGSLVFIPLQNLKPKFHFDLWVSRALTLDQPRGCLKKRASFYYHYTCSCGFSPTHISYTDLRFSFLKSFSIGKQGIWKKKLKYC